MRRLILVVLFLAIVPAMAQAQSDNRKAWGYLFAGAGGASDGETAFLHVGGGGEGMIYKGFGAGAELGYFTPVDAFGLGVGLLSTNLSGHFNRKAKVSPFVTGGYSLAFRSRGSSSGGNFGGGVQYWAGDNWGLRFEFRDHIFSSDSAHLYSVRVSISFR